MPVSDIKTGPTFQEILKEAASVKEGGSIRVTGLFGSSKAYLLSRAFKALKRPILAILPDDEEAEDFAGDLTFFLGKDTVLYYPSQELLPFDTQGVHPDISSTRLHVLDKLLFKSAPFLTVSSVRNLMQRVMPAKTIELKTVEVEAGADFPMDSLIASLNEAGYSRMSMVEERGEMSIRGGILDVFPPGFDSPLRIEFSGDTVESIRAFDISSQRSIRDVQKARMLPSSEAVLDPESRAVARDRLIERAEELSLRMEAWEGISRRIRDGVDLAGMNSLLSLFHERLDTLFDYLGEGALIAVVEPSRVTSESNAFEASVKDASSELLKKNSFFVNPSDLYLERTDLEDYLKKYPSIELETLRGGGGGGGGGAGEGGGRRVFEVESSTNADIRQGISARKGAEALFKPLADGINSWLDEGISVFVTAHNKGQAERTREILEPYGIDFRDVREGREVLEHAPGLRWGGADEKAGAPAPVIAVGSMCAGFRLPSEYITVVTEEDIFGERVLRRAPPKKKLEDYLLELNDLSDGDYIVHRAHGIGIYKGLKRLSVDSIEGEFLILEYRDGDKLYLPVPRMDLVSKYRGAGGVGGVEGSTPAIDKLGGPGWERTKKRARRAIERMAAELLKLYAEREVAVGFAFSTPDRLFREFEASFEYEETPDQARAIEEVLFDMESEKPMDRLICGDVGYGKTEVAMRAAFKAVLDNKQVAILVPTTVLAQQHYLTFKKRFAPYPVAMDVLSRFRSKKEQDETLRNAREGKVDILIGTHRLLQRDLEFKDLGLIVIDEEHRFGVKQKERLKKLKKSVDCLTLTATPIPRTLHMSVAGIRDLSIINTPPEDRLAIKTSVIRFDEGAVSEAIEREIKRGGQVFFVHNRIQSIGEVDGFLRRAVPGARVAVAHGKTRGAELEKKMLGFVNREYDILLSTAIIESGLDIPTANTIIINRAEMFGLAELYQLRGRVGRSHHRAYAYFICPDSSSMTEEARKRMEVVEEFSEPGSGFKVATYDLEIRGAGELLGTAQSGTIAEVGFEMYTRLLEETVRELKGEGVEEEEEPEINIRAPLYIPEEYMPEAGQRLGFYKRIASVRGEEEIDAIKEELSDRFGPPPSTVLNLIEAMELKMILKRMGASELSQKGNRLYITLKPGGGREAGAGGAEGAGDARGKIAEKALTLVKKDPRRFRITPDSRFVLLMPESADALKEARYILKELSSGCYS